MEIIYVVVLVVALFVLAIVVNAMQQHKQKVELERRQKLARFKHVYDEAEELISIAGTLPVGKTTILALNRRAKDALQRMLTVAPTGENKARFEDYSQRVNALASDNSGNDDGDTLSNGFEVPENDKQVIGMINAVKKLRNTLRNEHTKGKVDTQSFLKEDRTLVKVQLHISVESLIRRGQMAHKSQMLGSARQYFEKALKTLEDQTFTDDYISTRKAKVGEQLAEITEELRDSNARDAKNRKKDELEELFQPKRKW